MATKQGQAVKAQAKADKSKTAKKEPAKKQAPAKKTSRGKKKPGGYDARSIGAEASCHVHRKHRP